MPDARAQTTPETPAKERTVERSQVCDAWRWKPAEESVYLIGQFLSRFVPLPRALRSALSLQFLAIGQKP